jgi:hypothetical protein
VSQRFLCLNGVSADARALVQPLELNVEREDLRAGSSDAVDQGPNIERLGSPIQSSKQFQPRPTMEQRCVSITASVALSRPLPLPRTGAEAEGQG